MQSRIMRTLVILALALVLVGGISIGLGAQPHTAHAASTGPVTTTTHGSETIHLSASDCAMLQAAAHSTDASLCTSTHTWTQTATVNAPVMVARSALRAGANTASCNQSICPCPSGSYTFWDHDPVSWVVGEAYLELDTGFAWNGDCYWPTNYKDAVCVPNWGINAQFGDKKCYGYHVQSVLSQANVYSQYIFWGAPTFFSTWYSQRRECYFNSVGDCNWTYWIGT